MSGNDLLRYALDIGEQMLISGAEVSRVEDTISRICKAYRVKRVDVFSITSNIIVTIQTENEILTQTRRIRKSSINLDKLDRLNSLSRYICTNTPELSYIGEQLSLMKDNNYGLRMQYLIYAMISGSFIVFFGGSLRDGAVSALIGILSKLLIQYLQRAEKNVIFNNLLCSFLMGCLTILSVHIGLGVEFEKIAIGNIMLLIPGVVLTNSLRDLISGDTNTGLLRLSEAIVTALAIAIGFGLASASLGGIL